MDYLDIGFNELLIRVPENLTDLRQLTEDQSAYVLPTLSASAIAGGVVRSSNDRMSIDFTQGILILGDGRNNRIELNGPNGTVKVSRLGYDVENADIDNLVMSSDFSFVRETWLQMHPQHTDRWTTNSSYTDVEGSINSIDFSDWPDHDWYFEMIGFTDAGTGYWRLYNITASAEIVGTEITTTSTTSVRVRSSAITKPEGINSIKIQHKIVGGGGGDFVNSVMSRSVFRID